MIGLFSGPNVESEFIPAKPTPAGRVGNTNMLTIVSGFERQRRIDATSSPPNHVASDRLSGS